jgi:hypothetical protein
MNQREKGEKVLFRRQILNVHIALNFSRFRVTLPLSAMMIAMRFIFEAIINEQEKNSMVRRHVPSLIEDLNFCRGHATVI